MSEYSFGKALKAVLQFEGGYVKDPKDPGGETKYGITKRTYPNLDIAKLSLKDAERIYLNDFWQKCQCDDLPWPIAMIVFDCAVNQGTTVAIKLLQEALKVEIDGIIGSKTIGHARNSDWQEIVTAFTTLRIIRYTKTKNFDRYGKGWIRRAVFIAMVARSFFEGD